MSIYFLSPNQKICKEKLQKSAKPFAFDNDFEKRICLSPDFQIEVIYYIDKYTNKEKTELSNHSTEKITFFVYSPFQSIKNAINQVKELMEEKMPKEDENYSHNWTFTSIQTLSSCNVSMLEEAKEQAKQPALSDNYISALEQLLESKKEEQRLRLEAEANKDKVEFADQLLDITNAIDFKTAAEAMHLGFDRNTLFAKCRELGLIDRNNQPYQEFIDKGYFVLMEGSFSFPKTGDRILTTKTLVTAKGQQFLLKKLGK
jgi:phage antirepressor YoqD-like protein